MIRPRIEPQIFHSIRIVIPSKKNTQEWLTTCVLLKLKTKPSISIWFHHFCIIIYFVFAEIYPKHVNSFVNEVTYKP